MHTVILSQSPGLIVGDQWEDLDTNFFCRAAEISRLVDLEQKEIQAQLAIVRPGSDAIGGR